MAGKRLSVHRASDGTSVGQGLGSERRGSLGEMDGSI